MSFSSASMPHTTESPSSSEGGVSMHPDTQAVYDKLLSASPEATVHIIDNSWKHAGHVGIPSDVLGGTHLAIEMISPIFSGMDLLSRHRWVFTVLNEERKRFLHAMELQLKAPEEVTV
ncbi:MAG: BolA family protein [Vampirovibrionales bacterium]